MKKFLLTFIIFVLNFNLGLAQAKLNVDSIIKKIQFKVELFNIKTKDKLKYLNLKSIDTIGIKYLLVIPDYVWIENSEIINGVEFNDFEFKLITLDKLESISDKENKKNPLYCKGITYSKKERETKD
ncbi:hypothetical protein PG911_08750 [Tenacibaculum ovolyticum]|uniref:hypothetical protein n=1 Tax=Tenacibaculum ovolyticum TaxID=104270 RepID=UPI0022F3AB0E|nr:hypothetical protein [Tenacibaculum ovolyticum]WBX78334.1 hypothetical protein PG911_08750 [Tenacibaculum ovolyticum]